MILDNPTFYYEIERDEWIAARVKGFRRLGEELIAWGEFYLGQAERVERRAADSANLFQEWWLG